MGHRAGTCLTDGNYYIICLYSNAKQVRNPIIPILVLTQVFAYIV